MILTKHQKQTFTDQASSIILPELSKIGIIGKIFIDFENVERLPVYKFSGGLIKKKVNTKDILITEVEFITPYIFIEGILTNDFLEKNSNIVKHLTELENKYNFFE